MNNSPVKIMETVLRDGHQSLAATRMRTTDMIDMLEQLDDVGYFSLEASLEAVEICSLTSAAGMMISAKDTR